MRKLTFVTMLLVLALGVFPYSAHAASIIEDFNSPSGPDGQVLFDASPSYDGIEDSEAIGMTGGDNDGNSLLNGRVVSSEPFTITQDQSGTGFFLFQQSGAGTTAGEVWGTLTPVAVMPSTLYTFSFYLTNQNTTSVGLIQPFINGTSLGGPVSATGTFASPGGGWQPFSFSWNSGAATTADLSLVNQRSGGGGNDFGIDTIALTAVPEPSTSLLFATGLVALLAFGWRCRSRAA